MSEVPLYHCSYRHSYLYQVAANGVYALYLLAITAVAIVVALMSDDAAPALPQVSEVGTTRNILRMFI